MNQQGTAPASESERARAEEIVSYWTSQEMGKLFRTDPAFDAELEKLFGVDLQRATEGRLDHWSEFAAGSLALVILLDQICLNVHRGLGKRYIGGDLALVVSKRAIEKKHDQEFERDHRMWFYMPFMHSESLADQDEGIRLFEQNGLHDTAKYAHHHREIVAKFGRFPHRNKELGRESTPEEIAYLEEGGFSA